MSQWAGGKLHCSHDAHVQTQPKVSSKGAVYPANARVIVGTSPFEISRKLGHETRPHRIIGLMQPRVATASTLHDFSMGYNGNVSIQSSKLKDCQSDLALAAL